MMRQDQFNPKPKLSLPFSCVDSGRARGTRAPLEFGCSETERSRITVYQSLAFTASTSGFEKLSTALPFALITGSQQTQAYDCKYYDKYISSIKANLAKPSPKVSLITCI